MVRKNLLRSKKPGSIMALVAFAIVLLLLTGVGVLSLGQTSRIFSIRRGAEVAARSAADAGLTKCLWRMNDKLKRGEWDGHSLLWEFNKELPNFDGTYSYIAARAFNGEILPEGNDDLIDFIQSASWKEGDYVIKSRGRYGGARKTIYGIVRLKGCGDTGVLVRDTIVLKAGTLIDGRDSREPGNLDPDVEVEIGTISTSPGAVVLNNGVDIRGNVLVGVGGNVDTVIKDLGATTDLRYPMLVEPEFPLIFPPALPDKGELKAHGGDPIQISKDDSGTYSMIELKRSTNAAILEIVSGDVVLHVTGDIRMGQDCEIKIKKGATLSLYVDGNIRADEGSGFNNEGVPPDFKLWGNWCTDVEVPQKWQINAKSEYFGQLYAPNTKVTVMAKGDLYGAFTAESFEMKSGGSLFYDGALRDVNYDDDGVRFVLERWYER